MKEVSRVRHRYGRLLKKDNVVVFPGALDGLIESGLDAIEDVDYEKAVETFGQAYHFDSENMRILAPYAVALYETKDFDKAKEVATKLLHSGATDYLDAMELYLAISIQLQHYEEVEMTIEALLDEEVVTPDMTKKFHYLRDLNARLSNMYIDSVVEEVTSHSVISIEEFKTWTTEKQHALLATYEQGSLEKEILGFLVAIAGDEEVSSIVITYALVILCGAGYREEVTVRKFGVEKDFIPSELELPGNGSVTAAVIERVTDLYEKDPSRLQMAIDAIQRYDVMAYPFKWEGYSVEEISDAYMHYIESMFSGEPMVETGLHLHIRSIDEHTDY